MGIDQIKEINKLKQVIRDRNNIIDLYQERIDQLEGSKARLEMKLHFANMELIDRAVT
jgi:hypothetical protein